MIPTNIVKACLSLGYVLQAAVESVYGAILLGREIISEPRGCKGGILISNWVCVFLSVRSSPQGDCLSPRVVGMHTQFPFGIVPIWL